MLVSPTSLPLTLRVLIDPPPRAAARIDGAPVNVSSRRLRARAVAWLTTKAYPGRRASIEG